MIGLREYIEEKETDQIFSEGFITNAIGNILGLAGAGVIYAWIFALILKGGKKAIDAISNTLKGKEKIKFKKMVKEAKESPAVKDQMIKDNDIRKKYEDELENVIKAIKNKDLKEASNEFNELNNSLKNSTEVKKILIGEITKEYGYVISGDPTPGTPSFKAIRSIMGLPVAKAAAEAFEQSIQKIMGEKD